ncbi:MAG: zeta toxin family protein [Marinobacter sp.]|nr:zeta toxin family protein [Marinobacter sp.]
MGLTPEEQKIARDALIWAKKKGNKKAIARRLTDTSLYLPEKHPVSVFMAGSPGAGKTESSKELIDQFPENPILRIDADELRVEFEQYTGSNSHLFQSAVSVLVEYLHDMALKQSQSFIMDGTLHNEGKARDNIARSLKRGRLVQILYVYQDPLRAWEFVQARERLEGRRILPVNFIEQFLAARATVNALKAHFGADIKIDLLIKDYSNKTRVYEANIERIDYYVDQEYSRESLIRLIT